MYSQTDITGGGDGGQRPGLLGRIAPWAAAGGAAVGIAALLNRRNRRAESRERIDQSTVITEDSRRTSRPGSDSFVDEKYTEDGRRTHTWRDRLLGTAAGVGLFEGARRMFRGRQRDEEYSDVSYDRPAQSAVETETDIRRVEEGRVPASPAADRIRRTEDAASVPVAAASPSRRSALRARRSGDSIHSFDSASHHSPGRDKRRNHTVRDGIVGLGLTGYIRHKLNQRRDRREEQRVAEVHDRDRRDERIARMNSERRRYTGDGTPRRVRRRTSLSESEMSPISGSNPALSRHSLPRPAGGPSAAAGSRNDVVTNPNVPPPPPFTHATPQPSPAPPVDRHRLRDAAVPLAAGAAGAALGAAAAAERRASSRRRESGDDQITPPVSLKMKMHNDGRHVTLRRLDAAEAAAERERRRRDRTGSFSSVGASGDEHWRRTERRESAAEAAGMQRQNVVAGPPPGPAPVIGNQPLPPEVVSGLPPPPPIPAASGLNGSPGSGGGYDSSAVGSRADSNRRRRRIERARAEQERRGNRVDFTEMD